MLAFYAIIAVYVVAQAVFARMLGLKVECVAIGYAIPERFAIRWKGRHWEWRIGWLPLGGYTKFRNRNDINSVASEVSESDGDLNITTHTGSADDATAGGFASEQGGLMFEDISAVARISLMLAGPLSQFALGIAMLLIPLIVGAPQLRLTSDDAGTIRPVAVSGLSFSSEPSTIQRQVDFVVNVAGYLAPRYFFIEPLKGCGSWIGCFVTLGAVAKQSFSGWLTCVACVAIINGAANLLPIPVLNGGHILFASWAAITGSPVAEHVLIRLTIIGYLFILLIIARMICADVLWLWGLGTGAG